MEKLTDGKESKIRPLADVTPIWEREMSTYPDTIKVAMDDGTVVAYRIDTAQPGPEGYIHPAHARAMEILQRMPTYGGNPEHGYKARHVAQQKEDRWDRFVRAARKG